MRVRLLHDFLPPRPTQPQQSWLSLIIDALRFFFFASASSTAATLPRFSTDSLFTSPTSSSSHSQRPPDSELIALVNPKSDGDPSDAAALATVSDAPQAHASGVETTLTDGAAATVRIVSSHHQSGSVDSSFLPDAGIDPFNQTSGAEDGSGEREQQHASQQSSRDEESTGGSRPTAVCRAVPTTPPKGLVIHTATRALFFAFLRLPRSLNAVPSGLFV